jgi:hypothetical protein
MDKNPEREQKVGFGNVARAFVATTITGFLKREGALQEQSERHHEDNYRIARRTFWAVVVYSLITALIFAATAWQAYIANDNEKRSLRPYINISIGSLYNSAPDGSIPVWNLPVNVENNGATQTEHATSEIWCAHEQFSVDNPMEKESSGEKINRFFGPHQSGGIGRCSYTPDELRDASNNTLYLFVAARMVYFDTITHHDIHVTEFCARLVNIKGDFSHPISGSSAAMETLICDFHNCADDECPPEDANK